MWACERSVLRRWKPDWKEVLQRGVWRSRFCCYLQGFLFFQKIIVICVVLLSFCVFDATRMDLLLASTDRSSFVAICNVFGSFVFFMRCACFSMVLASKSPLVAIYVSLFFFAVLLMLWAWAFDLVSQTGHH